MPGSDIYFGRNISGIFKVINTLQTTKNEGFRTVWGGNSHDQAADSLDRVFITENTITTEPLDVQNVKALNSVCDAFIYGSDSLWGGGYEYQVYALEGVLFGSKICDGKHIVSFSTSFGSWQGSGADSSERQYISALLKRFQYISAREKSGALLCKTEFGTEASWTLDPVWLLPAAEYEKVMDTDTPLPDEFIFAYILQPLPDKLYMVKYLSDKFDRKVVFVSDMNAKLRSQFGEYKQYDFIYHDDMAVSTWLTAMKKAKFVITDSYHGMCFSMIFKKQFLSLYPRDGLIRYIDIQNLVDISDRINIKNIDEMEKALAHSIDYIQLDDIMNKKIEHDRNELKHALKKKPIKTTDVSVTELESAILVKKILKKLN